MRFWIVIIILLFTFQAIGQEKKVAGPIVTPVKPIIELIKLKTPNTEVEDFLLYLQDIPVENQQYIRAFSTYGVPKDIQEECILELSFILHSMIGLSDTDENNSGGYKPLAIAQYKDDEKSWDGKTIIPIQKIPKSDTLYWIDIREYNWTEQAWENITKFDGYMVEPIIQHANNGLLRLLVGNAIVRADWFIFHASKTTLQTDQNPVNTSIYRDLLYCKTKQPKTVDEFRKTWALKDINESRRLGNEYGTLVTKSKNVARHNRLLFGYRTEIGWLYQSYDVKNEQGKRDYVDNFYEFAGKPPTTFDGGEIFASNAIQLQVYDLYDGKQNLVDVADAGIVRHLSDVLGDARVSVAHSCYDCHAAGPIPSENTIAEFLKNNGKLYLRNKVDTLRVERAFYNKKFEESIEEHQDLYSKALSKVNGLLPEDNVKSYYKMVTWYNTPLDLNQVAYECGHTPESFKEQIKKGLQEYNNKLPGRLALLLQTGEPIPRAIWEAPNTDGIPGVFQQSMIILNGLTQIVTETTYTKVIHDCDIYSGGTTIIKKVVENTRIKDINKVEGVYTNVTLEDGTVGWILTTNINEVKK